MADTNPNPNPPAAPVATPAATPEPPVAPVTPVEPPAEPQPPAPKSGDKMVPASTVDAARQQERQKLHAKIERLEQDLGAAKALVDSQQTTITDLQKRLAEGTELNVEAIAQQATSHAESKLRGKYDTELAQLRGEVSALRDREKAAALELRKRDLIAAAGGPDKLIMEMVHGDTEEELYRSIELSKQVFERTVATVATATPAVPGVPSGVNPSPQSHVAGTPVPASVQPSASAVRSPGTFDAAEWSVRRKEVLAAVRDDFNRDVASKDGVMGA